MAEWGALYYDINVFKNMKNFEIDWQHLLPLMKLEDIGVYFVGHDNCVDVAKRDTFVSYTGQVIGLSYSEQFILNKARDLIIAEMSKHVQVGMNYDIALMPVSTINSTATYAENLINDYSKEILTNVDTKLIMKYYPILSKYGMFPEFDRHREKFDKSVKEFVDEIVAISKQEKIIMDRFKDIGIGEREPVGVFEIVKFVLYLENFINGKEDSSKIIEMFVQKTRILPEKFLVGMPFQLFPIDSAIVYPHKDCKNNLSLDVIEATLLKSMYETARKPCERIIDYARATINYYDWKVKKIGKFGSYGMIDKTVLLVDSEAQRTATMYSFNDAVDMFKYEPYVTHSKTLIPMDYMKMKLLIYSSFFCGTGLNDLYESMQKSTSTWLKQAIGWAIENNQLMLTRNMYCQVLYDSNDRAEARKLLDQAALTLKPYFSAAVAKSKDKREIFDDIVLFFKALTFDMGKKMRWVCDQLKKLRVLISNSIDNLNEIFRVWMRNIGSVYDDIDHKYLGWDVAASVKQIMIARFLYLKWNYNATSHRADLPYFFENELAVLLRFAHQYPHDADDFKYVEYHAWLDSKFDEDEKKRKENYLKSNNSLVPAKDRTIPLLFNVINTRIDLHGGKVSEDQLTSMMDHYFLFVSNEENYEKLQKLGRVPVVHDWFTIEPNMFIAVRLNEKGRLIKNTIAKDVVFPKGLEKKKKIKYLSLLGLRRLDSSPIKYGDDEIVAEKYWLNLFPEHQLIFMRLVQSRGVKRKGYPLDVEDNHLSSHFIGNL